MGLAQRTRPRAVVGAPGRAAWQLKSASRNSVSAVPRTIIFFLFLTIIAGELFLSVQQCIGVARVGASPPPIKMLPMIKMSQKRLLFLQFLLAFSRTTVHAYNSNQQ